MNTYNLTINMKSLETSVNVTVAATGHNADSSFINARNNMGGKYAAKLNINPAGDHMTLRLAFGDAVVSRAKVLANQTGLPFHAAEYALLICEANQNISQSEAIQIAAYDYNIALA